MSPLTLRAPGQVVDVSALQRFDRNWDGREPKEGEQEPTAYRYIILVRGSVSRLGRFRAACRAPCSCAAALVNAERELELVPNRLFVD
jgi:hypothetical protein